MSEATNAMEAMRPKADWKFHHLGVVVEDLDKAVASYEALGVLYRVSDLMVAGGKKAKLLGRFLRVGSLNIELWQPVRGNTVQQEFLDTSGEGINHIAFTVENYDADYKELTETQGLSVVFGTRPPITAAGGGVYFDTRERANNVLLELISPSPALGLPEWLA